MIESLGTNYTDYALKERLAAANKENAVKSAETKDVEASGQVADIAKSSESISDTEIVKTKAPQYDTIEISKEGAEAAYAQETEQTEAAPATVAPAAAETASTEEESVTSEVTQDLSSYTESELDDMVDAESITEAEKNAELAKRAAEEAQKENQQSSTDINESDGAVLTAAGIVNSDEE